MTRVPKLGILVCVSADEMMPGGVSAEVSPTTTQVPPETLRRLACDASLTTVVTDDQGTPLDIGRKRRTIPPAIRRALHVRDRHCRFPGCHNHRWLDAHHLESWLGGGATSQENLALLCHHHHQLVHEGGFAVAREHGALVFRRPDGSVIDAPHVAAAPLGHRVPAPRAPVAGPVDYHWAIGLVAPCKAA